MDEKERGEEVANLYLNILARLYESLAWYGGGDGGFFLACEDLGKTFDQPAIFFFFLFFFSFFQLKAH